MKKVAFRATNQGFVVAGRLTLFIALWGGAVATGTAWSDEWNGGVAGQVTTSAGTKVGIGTSNPNSALDVNGSASISGNQTVTGLLTASGGFHVNGGSSGDGRIWKSGLSGVAIRGVPGSAYSFGVESAGGNILLVNPVNTSRVDILGSDGLRVANNLSVSGGANSDIVYGNNFRMTDYRSISLSVGTEAWVKLASFPNNAIVDFTFRNGSNNSEEVAELKIFGTWHTNRTGVQLTRQTYNRHLKEVRITGNDGGEKTVYVLVRTTSFAPTISWAARVTRGAIWGIFNVEEAPTGGLSVNVDNSSGTVREVAGNLDYSLNNLKVASNVVVDGMQSNGSDLVLSASDAFIRSNTSDGADTKRISMGAGGAIGISRSAVVSSYGNEHATEAGRLYLSAGTVATGDIILSTQGTPRLTIANGGTSTFHGPVSLSSTLGLGVGAPTYASKRFTVIGNSFDNTAVQWENTDVNTIANGRAFNFGITDVSTTEGRFDLTQPGERTVLSVFRNGNLGIGSTADGGEKLQVTGSARVAGHLTATGGVHVNGGSNSDIVYGNHFRMIDYRSISLGQGTEAWVKLATVANNTSIDFMFRNGSTNSEEVAELRVLGTYHTERTAVQLTRQTYNRHLKEVRVTGTDGGAKTVYVLVRTTIHAPTISWAARVTRGSISSIHNIEETPSGGLAVNVDNSSGTVREVVGNMDYTVNNLKAATVIANGWTITPPDYVFEKDYKLAGLEQVEAFVTKNKHLPEVPSAKKMKEEGLDLVKMNFLLLKKVEELTLHAIRLEKEMKRQSSVMERQQAQIQRLVGKE